MNKKKKKAKITVNLVSLSHLFFASIFYLGFVLFLFLFFFENSFNTILCFAVFDKTLAYVAARLPAKIMRCPSIKQRYKKKKKKIRMQPVVFASRHILQYYVSLTVCSPECWLIHFIIN